MAITFVFINSISIFLTEEVDVKNLPQMEQNGYYAAQYFLLVLHSSHFALY
jgi:hypothetical protein